MSEEQQEFEDYLKLVERCINKNVDPNDDFLDYACGKFRNEEFDNKNGDWPPSMFGVENHLENIFENEQISDPNFVKVRDFIRAKRICLEGGLKEHMKCKEFITFCGSLPAFNNNWNEKDFNWPRTFGILYVFQCYTMFSLTMEHSGDIKEIFVELDYDAALDDSNIDRILDQIEIDTENHEDIVKAVSFIKENVPQELGEEIYVTSGTDLQEHYKDFDLREFIEMAFCIEINENDKIYLDGRVLSFLSFLAGIDRRLVANYLTFLFARNCFYGQSQTFDDQLVHFIPVMISTGFATYFNEKENQKREYLKNSFNQSFALIEDSFPNNIRLDEEFSFRTNDDDILNYVQKYYNQPKVRAEYDNIYMTSTDFYQNLYNIRNHGIPNSLKTYKSSTASDKRMNSLVTSFLRKITIHWNKPMVFHFAGQEVGKWISLIYRRNKDPLCANTEEYEKFKKILNQQIEQFPNLKNEFLADDCICSIEAISRAYGDYEIWMKENEAIVQWQNEILSRINLDCRKLFFVTFAQHWICCEQPARAIVLLTLMNFEEFSNIFKCNFISPMN